MKFWKSLLIGSFLLMTLTACDGDVREPLKVGTNVWPGYEPGYLAQDLGYFSDKQIILRQFQSATENIRAFRNEVVDVAALTLDEALLLVQGGIDIRIFLVADVSYGGDVIMARPEYTSMRALKGKTIGVENSALGAYVLARALELNDLSVSDIKVHPLTVDQSEGVYSVGSVDAVVTFEPFRSHLLKRGAVEVFSSREIPNEIVDVLVVRAKNVERFGDNLKILTDGWLRAAAYIENEPKEAGKLLGQRLSLAPEEALASFDGLVIPDRVLNRKLIKPGGQGSLTQTLSQLRKVLTEKKLVTKDIKIDNIFLDTFVNH